MLLQITGLSGGLKQRAKSLLQRGSCSIGLNQDTWHIISHLVFSRWNSRHWESEGYPAGTSSNPYATKFTCLSLKGQLTKDLHFENITSVSCSCGEAEHLSRFQLGGWRQWRLSVWFFCVQKALCRQTCTASFFLFHCFFFPSIHSLWDIQEFSRPICQTLNK